MRKLPESELNCMLVIWGTDRPMTRIEIQAELENGDQLSATALLSFLSRLHEKGFLKVQKIKKLNYYEALVTEQEYKKHDSKNLLNKMYNNSIKNFMTALYDGETLEEKDIEELREFINQKARKVMKLRAYKSEDLKEIATLFYDTVHTINAGDYGKEQLDVWATGNIDSVAWDTSFLAHHTVIAEEDDKIIGFGDMDSDGYLDRLYVHRDYQRQGVATKIVRALEEHATTKGVASFVTYASITAVPFFEKMNYQIVKENIVVRNGIELINYRMVNRINLKNAGRASTIR